MGSSSAKPSSSGISPSTSAAPTLLITSPTAPTMKNASPSSSPTQLPPIAVTPNSSRSTSGTMTNSPTYPPCGLAPCNHPPSRRRRSSACSSSGSATPEACEACLVDRPYVERIRSVSHVFLALRLLFTDPQRRRALLTNWIHVPLGITSLLFLVWLIKQAMDRAPFRFPSPVLAMLLLFVVLLALDYLSTTRWAMRKKTQQQERKVLLQPMLTLLEAPCDFCLRYMSVMFTPSFILIPAREIINGREIGLITGWFAASQLAALIFPVLLHRLIRYVVGATKHRVQQRKDKRSAKTRRADEQRRASVATLVAVMSNINALPAAATSADTGVEKSATLVGGAKMGSVATGLSGMTAIATAPLTLNNTRPVPPRIDTSQRQDAQRQLRQVQLETARQQGDPYATANTPLPEHHHHYPLSSAPNSPAPVHNFRLHQSHKDGYFGRGRGLELVERPELERSRSLARSWIDRSAAAKARARDVASVSPSRARPRSGNAAKGKFGAAVVGPGSALRYASRRPQSANATSKQLRDDDESALSPTFDEYIFQARQDLIERRRSSIAALEVMVDPKGEEGETLVMPTLAPPTPIRGSQDEVAKEKAAVQDDDIEAKSLEVALVNEKSSDKDVVEQQIITTDAAQADEPELDAIDRLVERLWNSIPWIVFSLLLVLGIPLFYTIDVSLPLFLGVNLVTFLASITLVPAKIRRYAHPILTTSVATVFVLWAFGAIRGWSLKRTLLSYSVDAKYTVLWSLSGYEGPVIGAGDVLFSTLDAGIVSLAIPMYRYRWDLWFHLIDMLVVLLPCSLLSIFVWPTVAAAIGIAPERALAFASRFMSTPLAIELSLTIGADESITVVLVVITGIVISIFKDPFFRLFGLNPDQDGPTDQADGKGERDYLTIGIAMGSTAGAIGASSLISKPRSMAIASLSFVLFGAILLIFAAIPPVVDTMRMLAKAPLVFTPAS